MSNESDQANNAMESIRRNQGMYGEIAQFLDDVRRFGSQTSIALHDARGIDSATFSTKDDQGRRIELTLIAVIADGEPKIVAKRFVSENAGISPERLRWEDEVTRSKSAR